jgi:hypothetical protein
MPDVEKRRNRPIRVGGHDGARRAQEVNDEREDRDRIEQARSMNGQGLDDDGDGLDDDGEGLEDDGEGLSIDGAGLGDEGECHHEAAPALHLDEEGLHDSPIVAARLRGGPHDERRGPLEVVSGPPR